MASRKFRFAAIVLGVAVAVCMASASNAQTCLPPPSGLIAWWPLDETGGTIAQDIVGSNPAGYSGAPAPEGGQAGGALRFDGQDDHLAAPDSDLWAFGSGDFTIEFWANFDTSGSGSIGEPGDIFIGNDEGPRIRNKWFFALGGGVLNFHINGSGIGPKFFPQVPFLPSPGQWYHLAVTRSVDTYSIYINGQVGDAASNSDVIPNPNAPLTIGQAEEIGFFDGLLDEMTVYDRALSESELQAIFDAGTSGKCKEFRIVPDRGGDTGTVTARIFGNGFQEGATVTLVRDGQQDIAGDPVMIESSSIIQSSFDLVGKDRGPWDVVVTNPDGISFTRPGSFTIEAGREAEVWAEVVGFGLIRPDRPQAFHIFYGNRGNIDAIGVPITLAGIPLRANVVPGFEIGTVPSVNGEAPVTPEDVPFALDKGNELVVSLFDPVVPPGTTRALQTRLSIPPNSSSFSLRSWANVFTSSTLLEKLDAIDCITGLIRKVLPPNVQCAADVTDEISRFLGEIILTKQFRDVTNYVQTVATLLKGCTNVLEKFEEIEAAVNVVDQITSPSSALPDACQGLIPPDSPSALPVTPVASFDPNDKIGSLGVSEANYLAGEEPLRYVIRFENLETATAPAQEVVITDVIAGNSDLDTFSLGPIAFADRQVLPPFGSRQFEASVDLRPGRDLLVRIAAGLDEVRGVVSWRFTSIDPDTGLPPVDPLAGFLPPNVNPPEGEGSVLFTVMAKGGLPTGAKIENDASIVFDTNEPIQTPIWLNTLDNSAPQSTVGSLDPVQETVDFAVDWSGSDQGAGIRDFDVFVSENGGAFMPWQVNTRDLLATFVGEDAKEYAFYSIARDLTGNVEDKAPSVEAHTLVSVPPDDSDGDGLPDDQDECPNSIITQTVAIGECDSGVPNTIMTDGCSISDRIEQWTADARNHGQFVSAIAQLANRLRNKDIITGEQKGAIQSCAAQSDLP